MRRHTIRHKAVREPVLEESFVSEPRPGDLLQENIYQRARSETLLSVVKPVVGWMVNKYSDLSIEMSESTRQFLEYKSSLDDHNGVMFIATHLSLYEAVGFPYSMGAMGFPVPYMVMGNNLVKGQLPVYLMTKLGTVVSERDNTEKQIARIKPGHITKNDMKAMLIEISRRKMEATLSAGNFLGVFATDGRARDGLTPVFKSNPVQAAMNLDTPIITVRTVYRQINEEEEFSQEKTKSYTFKIKDFPKWFRNIGEVYVSFGEHIVPSEVSKNRKDLAEMLRVDCLNHTVILPEHIVAYSKMQGGELRGNIKYTIEKLEPFTDKFRINNWDDGLSLDSKVGVLIGQTNVHHKNSRLITFYGNQIKHYVEGMYYGRCK